MRSHLLRTTSLILVVMLLCTSCAPLPQPGTALTDEERESAKKSCIAKYTALGAVGGGVVGLLLGRSHHKAEGALIGAAAGGALAFALAWGHCLSLYSDLRSFPVAGAEETARRIGYSSSQGTVTRVESFSLNPSGVAPGGRVKMDGSYYVMAPEGTTEVKVVETRSLEFFDPSENQWKDLGAIDQEVTSALGTRQAEGNFDIPADAPEGLYRVTLKVAAQGKQDQSTKELTVKKGLAMGHASPATASIDAASSLLDREWRCSARRGAEGQIPAHLAMVQE